MGAEYFAGTPLLPLLLVLLLLVFACDELLGASSPWNMHHPKQQQQHSCWLPGIAKPNRFPPDTRTGIPAPQPRCDFLRFAAAFETNFVPRITEVHAPDRAARMPGCREDLHRGM